MDVRNLFLHELGALDRRLRSSGDYETLMIAASLRKLLLDARPLAIAVNQKHRLRLRFLAVCQREDAESLKVKLVEAGLVLWSRGDGFDPATAKAGSAAPSELSLPALLSCVLLMWRGYDATVHDVIDHVAHVGGAVHIGEPRSEKDAALRDMAKSVRVGGKSPEVQALLAVGRVVLRGLTPLREAVTADLAREGNGPRPAPIRLPGVSADEFITALERMGFHHKFDWQRTAAAATEVEPVELSRWDDDFFYNLVVVRDGPAIRLVTASLHAVRETKSAHADIVAGAYLASIATVDHLSPEPERVEAWVRANVAQPSATLLIGSTFFEIDAETTIPGQQYRLTIAAAGARAVT